MVRERLTDAELDDKRRGWSRPRNIGQACVKNARDKLGRAPKYDFPSNLDRLKHVEALFSLLETDIGLNEYTVWCAETVYLP